MGRFAAGETDVLVATTVIEVGVDVPNAAVMVICDADRFGISQLHQLRGRIGRGGHPGRLPAAHRRAEPAAWPASGSTPSPRTRDGFALAEVDLEQRREGDVLGASQSGHRSSLRLLRVLRRRRPDRPRPRPGRALRRRRPRPGRPRPRRHRGTDVERQRRRRLAGAHVSRIIAGSRGGRRLTHARRATAPGPTTDRVREALFSAVAAWAGTADAARRRGAGRAGLRRPLRRLRRRRPRGGQPGRRAGAAGRGRQADGRRHHRATSATWAWPPASAPARVETVVAAPRRAGLRRRLRSTRPYELDGAVLAGVIAGAGRARLAGPRRACWSSSVSRRTPDLVWPAPVVDTWSRALRRDRAALRLLRRPGGRGRGRTGRRRARR